MPQLDVATFPSQLFWLVVCFVVLYGILSFVAIPKIKRVLENREDIREKKINQAGAYREEAERLLADYEKMLAQTRANTHQQYQAIVHDINLEVAERKRELFARIQERLHVAEQDLYRVRIAIADDMHFVAQEIAAEILHKLTGHTYSVDQLTPNKGKE